jgi:hypothetical protein
MGSSSARSRPGTSSVCCRGLAPGAFAEDGRGEQGRSPTSTRGRPARWWTRVRRSALGGPTLSRHAPSLGAAGRGRVRPSLPVSRRIAPAGIGRPVPRAGTSGVAHRQERSEREAQARRAKDAAVSGHHQPRGPANRRSRTHLSVAPRPRRACVIAQARRGRPPRAHWLCSQR